VYINIMNSRGLFLALVAAFCVVPLHAQVIRDPGDVAAPSGDPTSAVDAGRRARRFLEAFRYLYLPNASLL
jgi:hypothetical protein